MIKQHNSILMDTSLDSSYTNISDSLFNKTNIKLHNKLNHPINIIKCAIYNYFKSSSDINFETFDDLSNIVSTTSNFDDLLIPQNHPSRSKSDTYYINSNYALRTHTSAHQCELLRQGKTSFLVTGDVYRKDEIDRCHYNIFHQMEGVNLMKNTTHQDIEIAEQNLKKTICGLIDYLFPNCQFRFNGDYFPFTYPSFEVEVYFNDKWLEIMGCGVIHRTILTNNKIDTIGWAFGFGLERMAMILFNIPDIRLFWSQDEKFLNQFSNDMDIKNINFVPYSKLSSISRDISFFVPADQISLLESSDSFSWNNVNDFYDLVRETCLENIENVMLFDHFYNNKKNKYSNTFKLTFSPNSDMTNSAEFADIVNEYMKLLQETITEKLTIEPRF